MLPKLIAFDTKTGKTEDWSDTLQKVLNQQNQNNTATIPTQTQIQQNIQKIAPNPTRFGNNNPVSNTQGYNGVNQAVKGILGFLKSTYTNMPKFTPHTSDNPLSSQWFNTALQNVQAHNQQKIGLGLSRTFGSILNNILATNAQQNIAKINNQTRLQEEQIGANTKLGIAKLNADVARERNNILDNYYKGLISQSEAQKQLDLLKTKAIQQVKEEQLNSDLYKARYNKYPDIQTFTDNLLSQAYDGDLNVPKDEVLKAYNYYLQTGKLPQPIIQQKDGLFGTNKEIVGFNYENNQEQQMQTQTQQEKQTNNTQNLISNLDKLKQEAEKQFGAKVTGAFQDPEGNIYFALANGKYLKVK